MRSRLVERDAARRTHQVTAVKTHVVRIVVVDHHRSLALPHGLLQALEHPRPDIGLHDQAIDDKLDMVNLIAVEPLAGMNFLNLAVHAGIQITFLGQTLEQLPIVSLAAAHQRSQKRDLFSGKVAKDQIDDLFVGMMYHHLARYGRIGFRSTGEKQAQKVVDLRNVERGFLFVVFCSIEMTGLSPVILSTSGRSIVPTNWRA